MDIREVDRSAAARRRDLVLENHRDIPVLRQPGGITGSDSKMSAPASGVEVLLQPLEHRDARGDDDEILR